MAIRLGVQTENIEGLDVLRNRLGNSGQIRSNVTPILREASRIGAEAARFHAPKGATGRLEDQIENSGIVFRARGDLVAASFGVQPVPNPGRGSRLYPLYVHEGTGIYGRLGRVITPKRSKAMVFPGGGKPWPTMFGTTGAVVKRTIKGQRPQPYMRAAYDEARAYVDHHFNELFDRLVS